MASLPKARTGVNQMLKRKLFYYDQPVNPDDFVGRWDLVEEIVGDLCCVQPSSWSLIGGRRFGKTSVLKVIESQLLVRVSQSDSIELHVFPLFVDLKLYDKRNQYDIYFGILEELCAALRTQNWLPFDLKETDLYAFINSHSETVSILEFRAILVDLEQRFENVHFPFRLILLLDEVESTTDFDWSEKFFDQLRAMIHTGSLSGFLKLVLTGASKLIQIKQSGSPLLNAVKIKYLSAIPEMDIETLIMRGGNIPRECVDVIQFLCGGHPFIAQYIMHHLSVEDFDQITVKNIMHVAHHMRVHRVNDFLVWWNALGDMGQQVYAVLAAEQDWMNDSDFYLAIQDSEQLLDQGLAALCYHGLAIQDPSNSSRYRVSGDLFRDWFIFNMRQKLSAFINKDDVEKSDLPAVIRVFVEHVEQNIGTQTNVNGTINGNVLAGYFNDLVNVNK